MKTLSVKCTPGMSDFFDEVLRPDNAFAEDGKPYVKRNLACGALTWWILTMLWPHISERQYRAYTSGLGNNETIFQLGVAYLRAKRGVKGYRIDRQGIVWGPNLNQEII